MFDFLEGSLVSQSPTDAVLDVGGQGFRLELSLNSSDRLPVIGTTLRLLVHHKIQDDRMRFFGFVDVAERELFRQLISVAGIGPAHALALLSAADPAGVWGLIREGDWKSLARTKGIGPKIAQRACNELGDRALRVSIAEADSASDAPAVSHLGEDAISALLVLGYSEAPARKAVDAAVKRLGTTEVTVQNIIREALQSS